MKNIFKGALTAVLAACVLLLPAFGGQSRAQAKAKADDTAEGTALEKLDLGNFYGFWTDWKGAAQTTLAADTEETYAFDDRQWNGLPSVCLTTKGRLWAGFMTGGYGEPSPLNYNAFHYSDDGGKSWSKESLVIDPKNEEKGLYQPHLFMLDGVMQLWLNHGGQNVIVIDNPDCENPSENLSLTQATKVLNYNSAHRPTILSEKWENIWLFSAENSSSDENAIFASTNGKKWEWYSSVSSTNGNRKWWESQVVECADGSLIHMSRLETGGDGGIQLAYSYDGGETWTETKANNGRPFNAYSNKSHMQRLESGNLLLIVGCSTKARENLTAFLSEDNGKTWPYSLSLDARDHFGDWFGCGYPEAANLQGENGEIYAVWDARFSYGEIACAKFTEADVKAGKIVTEGCYTYDTVVRNRVASGTAVADIEGVRENFTRFVTVETGTKASDATATLPDRLTAVKGNENYTLTGAWVCADYDETRAGRYTFRFDTPDLPDGVGDSYAYLTVCVTVAEKTSGGCQSSGTAMATLAAGLGAGLGAYALHIKSQDKRKDKEKKR